MAKISLIPIGAADLQKTVADLSREPLAMSRAVLVVVAEDEAMRRRKVHDLGTALARVKGVLTLLESGRDISAEQRARFAEMLSEAYEILVEESALLETIYLE